MIIRFMIFAFPILLMIGCNASEKSQEKAKPDLPLGTSRREIPEDVSLVCDIDKFNKVTLNSNLVDICIPRDLAVMDDEMINFKYGGSNPFEIVYSDYEGEVNIAFGTLQGNQSLENTSKLQEYLIQTLSLSNKIKFHSSFQNINGKDFVVFEFFQDARDKKRVYNKMEFIAIGDRILVLTFNCTTELLSKWKSKAEVTLSSITIH